MKRTRICLANSFTHQQVALMNSLFTKLSMGQDVRGLLRTGEYATVRRKFLQMDDKYVMGVVDPEPVPGEC